MPRIYFALFIGLSLVLSSNVQANSRVFSPNRHPTIAQQEPITLPAPQKRPTKSVVAHKHAKRRIHPHKHRRQKMDLRIKKNRWKIKPSQHKVKASLFKVKKAPLPPAPIKPIQPSPYKIKPYRYYLK